jgi:hypothetical protein
MEKLQIIEQAINLAVTKGVYNLQEIDVIIKALKELSAIVEQGQQACQKECKNE